MLTAGPARAGELPVMLDVDPCVFVDPARLGELLTLELGVLSDAAPSGPQPRTLVRITCDDPSVILTVDDGRGTAPDRRRLDWAAYPQGGRPRLLALALSEMIAGRWRGGIAAPPVVASHPVVVAAPPPVTDTRSVDPGSLDLGLLVSAERLGRPQTMAAGLDLDLSWHVRRWLTVHADGRAVAASFDGSPGTISARALSVLIAALFGTTRGPLWLGAGPGIRGGWAWLHGQPSGGAPAGRAYDAAWWGPSLVAGASYQATQHLLAVLMIEAGYVARPVVGEIGAPAPAPAETVALDRLWITAAAGAAWRF